MLPVRFHASFSLRPSQIGNLASFLMVQAAALPFLSQCPEQNLAHADGKGMCLLCGWLMVDDTVYWCIEYIIVTIWVGSIYVLRHRGLLTGSQRPWKLRPFKPLPAKSEQVREIVTHIVTCVLRLEVPMTGPPSPRFWSRFLARPKPTRISIQRWVVRVKLCVCFNWSHSASWQK